MIFSLEAKINGDNDLFPLPENNSPWPSVSVKKQGFFFCFFDPYSSNFNSICMKTVLFIAKFPQKKAMISPCELPPLCSAPKKRLPCYVKLVGICNKPKKWIVLIPASQLIF